MDEEKKVTGFWSSLEKHPIRTILVVGIIVDGLVRLFHGNN